MKYLSIDIETTRISPARPDGILMASFVVEDTNLNLSIEDLPHMTVLVDQGETSSAPWSRIAMAMNAWILVAIDLSNKFRMDEDADNTAEFFARKKQIDYLKAVLGSDETVDRAVRAASQYSVVKGEAGLVEEVTLFLDRHFGNHTITVAGKNVAGFDVPFLPSEITRRFSHRTIDPSMMFLNWEKDKDVPGMHKCLERAGVSMPGAAHDALADARAIVAILRKTYPGVND